MRILVITEYNPYPPKSGRELPIAEIFRHIALNHEVVILVANNDPIDFESRLINVPTSISKIVRFNYQKQNKWSLLLRELSGGFPAYFNKVFSQKSLHQLDDLGSFDWIWVSPVSFYGLVLQAKKSGYFKKTKVALGVNDVKTSLYADSLNEMVGFGKLRIKYIKQYLRSFWMKRSEKSYLQLADLIHVQTEKEKMNALQVLGSQTKIPILALANGVGARLDQNPYSAPKNKKVLYMTHLDRGRREESSWFIGQVWPKISAQHPDAELLLVGRAPDENDIPEWVKSASNIKVLGFVSDLQTVMSNCRLGVIPIFHSTGLINRLQDYLMSGLPTICTKSVAATLQNTEANTHVLLAESITDYVNQINRLFEENELCDKLSQEGFKLMQQRNTWPQVAQKVEEALQTN